MDVIRVKGGVPLRGKVMISGAKNAALPLMTASLLTEEPLTLSNLPHLADISMMANLLGQHGVSVSIDGSAEQGGEHGRVITLCASDITSKTAPYDIVRKMRASVWVLGPLLARFGEAVVSLPGGCAIGTRPIDMHLYALERLGATISLEDGYIHASVKGRLRGGDIIFDKVSVGATVNALMAAALADGQTVIKNAAEEPEVCDLAECLNKMGANITGMGTDTLIIKGVEALHGTTHSIIPDRIEAGTFATAAVITKGDLELVGIKKQLLTTFFEKLQDTGASIIETQDGLRVKCDLASICSVDISTQPFPGFPTDMQAQFMALMTVAEDASLISETIFENRFMHVSELMRMGANISVKGRTALVRGVAALKGAQVMATDLRASVSLVLAGLVAEGETIIHRVYHIDRGYERIEEKLAACGAQIERVRD